MGAPKLQYRPEVETKQSVVASRSEQQKSQKKYFEFTFGIFYVFRKLFSLR